MATSSTTRRSRRKPAAAKTSVVSRAKLYSMMLLSGAIVVSGFFYAARQHFASIDFGIRNSRLRRQLDDLEAEKRRLLVTREVSLSPNEIKKAARKLSLMGTEDVAARTTSPSAGTKPSLASTAQQASFEKRTASPASSDNAVVKTAYTRPASAPASAPKPEVAGKRNPAESERRRTVSQAE